LKHNKLLQQIGMPFISSIFTRTTSPFKSSEHVPIRGSSANEDNIEQMPLTSGVVKYKEEAGIDQQQQICETETESRAALREQTNRIAASIKEANMEALRISKAQYLSPDSINSSLDHINKTKAPSISNLAGYR
jgi:hypothetical protein